MKVGDRIRTRPRTGVVVDSHHGGQAKSIKFDDSAEPFVLSNVASEALLESSDVTVTLTDREVEALLYDGTALTNEAAKHRSSAARKLAEAAGNGQPVEH